MASARDVAQYILERHGAMTTMKLQKLVYYSQAWTIVWTDDVLFEDRIEAWKNGPVTPNLWNFTRGQFRIGQVPHAFSGNVTEEQRQNIDKVCDFYATKDAQWLSDLTHMEAPWKDAYVEGENREITPAAMSEYYASLTEDAAAEA